MIDELKFLIDETDKTNSKKTKELLLKVASLKEENQKSALKLIKLIIKGKE